MKKNIGLVAALMMVLIGCSGTANVDEGWPKEVKGKDYTVTKLDTTFTGNTGAKMLDYLDISQSQFVDESALIAKLEIIAEPIEYEIYFKHDDTFMETLTFRAFEAKVIKVFYSDADIKEGQIVKFLREEFSAINYKDEILRFQPAETIELKNKMQYILLLTRPETAKYPESSNYAEACSEIADYVSKDPCRTIIICNKDGSYEFDMNFSSLTGGAEDSDSPYGMQMMISHEKEFEANVQKLADSKKQSE